MKVNEKLPILFFLSRKRENPATRLVPIYIRITIDVDLKSLSLPAILKYPWSVTTRIYFVIGGGHLLVKQNEASDFSVYPENFVIGPRLENNIIDLGPYQRECYRRLRYALAQILIPISLDNGR